MGIRDISLISILTALLAVIALWIYQNYPSGRTGVIFYHYTRENPGRNELKATAKSLSSLNIDSTTPLTVIIHGYTESSFRSWVVEAANDILAIEAKSIVILVDYFDLTTLSRPYMAKNVQHIANKTAALLDLLVEEKDLKLSLVHLIGFSLGGRISGVIGNRIKTGKIGRITGLDASYPWHLPADSSKYLDASDAELVVNLRTSPVGAQSPPGHIDFYAHDGLMQPGCDRWYFPKCIQNTCSHYRSVFMLLESAKNAHQRLFPACSCESWEKFKSKVCNCQIINHFGFFPDPSIHGSFYLTTNASPPYSRVLE